MCVGRAGVEGGVKSLVLDMISWRWPSDIQVEISVVGQVFSVGAMNLAAIIIEMVFKTKSLDTVSLGVSVETEDGLL